MIFKIITKPADIIDNGIFFSNEKGGEKKGGKREQAQRCFAKKKGTSGEIPF